MPQDPNFALYTQAETNIPLLMGISGFTNEQHEFKLTTTSHPIESGASLTDNAVRNQHKLVLEGRVTDLLPVPQEDPSTIWSRIFQLMEERTPIMVITALRTYNNMLITRAKAPVNVRNRRSLNFRLELLEVLFATTDTTRLSPIEVDSSGPAAMRTREVDGGERATLTESTIASEIEETQSKVSMVQLPESDELLRQTQLDLASQRLMQARSKLNRVRDALAAVEMNEYVTGTRRLIRESRESIDQVRRVLNRPGRTANLLQRTVKETLNLSNDARATFRSVVGGNTYRFRTFWQPSDQSWYLSVSDEARNPVLSGARLGGGTRIFDGPGSPIAGTLNVRGSNDEPGEDAWTDTHRLVYDP